MRVRVGDATVRFTGRLEGDLGHAGAWVGVDEVAPAVAGRRAAVCALPWTWLRQVHGSRVVTVTSPGEGAGEHADAAVTAAAGCALAILTADCAPVALVSEEGVLGAAHAGWRGLVAGVIEGTLDAMRSLGARRIHAVLGPCVRPGCYEFGAADLDRVAERLGPGVRALDANGRPALDVPAAVRASLALGGVESFDDTGLCTACSPAYFSHRARGERERQALVLWR